MTRKKNEFVAAIASLFVTGLGQLYNGQIGKGILYFIIFIFFFISLFQFIGFLLLPIWWLIGIVDAYITACKINNGNWAEKFVNLK